MLKNIKTQSENVLHVEPDVHLGINSKQSSLRLGKCVGVELPLTCSQGIGSYYINCSVLQGFLPPRNVVSEHT